MSGQHGEGITAEMTVPPALEGWLADHPYLRGVARFQRSIENALRGGEPAAVPPPRWEDHADAFNDGIPVLRSRPLDKTVVAHAGKLLIRLLERFSESESTAEAQRACTTLLDKFRQAPGEAALMVEQMVAGGDECAAPDPEANPGFARFLCWRALEAALRPWIASFTRWRGDDLWGRHYCPFCGSHATMAQIARTSKGRERLLSCGCCRSRWSYQRTRCPFCGNYNQDKMEILELDGEERFRIDVCRDCNGYLKTYTGEGEEEVLLADWSTLHLDILAGQEGLQRRADSLYEL
jgi:FdhE protein